MIESLKKIVVCGCFRSGTTPLARILNDHPQLFVTSELLTYLPGDHYRGKIKRIIDQFPYVGDSIFRETLDNRFKEFVDKINPDMDRYKILNTVQQLTGTEYKYYGDKLPEYTFFLPELVKRFSPKVIFCIRDPRDIIEAQIRNYWKKLLVDKLPLEEIHRLHFWCRPEIGNCISPKNKKSWLTFMLSWESFKQQLNMDYYEFYYSNAAKDVTKVALELASFLNIEPEGMIQAFKKGFNPKRHENWKVHFPRLTEVLPDSWKQMMTRYNLEVE